MVFHFFKKKKNMEEPLWMKPWLWSSLITIIAKLSPSVQRGKHYLLSRFSLFVELTHPRWPPGGSRQISNGQNPEWAMGPELTLLCSLPLKSGQGGLARRAGETSKRVSVFKSITLPFPPDSHWAGPSCWRECKIRELEPGQEELLGEGYGGVLVS